MPKFSPWNRVTLSGEILDFERGSTKDYVGQDYYFYEVFKFWFSSQSSFQMKIQFNMTEGALIIEPRGIFFSPLVGFSQDNTNEANAEVFFPSNYKVKRVASSGISTYTIINSSSVHFNLQDTPERLQIEFETAVAQPTYNELNQSVFRFLTVERYENYAAEILDLYDSVYGNFTELFNVTLTDIEVRFFIPEFETLLAVGGYVPFINQKMGEININIFFVRAVKGTIEVIAIHELIHHFLWKAGLSPDFFLWFHEGTAQYVSIETVEDLGYKGASLERERLEQGVSHLIPQTPENLGFLQEWTPERQPRDTAELYVASYYVISKLAEKYGELDFYKRFFKLIQGLELETNDELALYLSMAANASVDLTLRQWGFDIQLLYTLNQSDFSIELIYEAKKAIDGVSPIFQPYKLIARSLYQQAWVRIEQGDYEGAAQLLNAAILLANLAPLLTLLTITVLLAIIVYALHKRAEKPALELPPPPPTFEETNA